MVKRLDAGAASLPIGQAAVWRPGRYNSVQQQQAEAILASRPYYPRLVALGPETFETTKFYVHDHQVDYTVSFLLHFCRNLTAAHIARAGNCLAPGSE